MASPDLVTPSAVETYLGLTAERDAAELGRVVAAVNDLIGEWTGLTDADEAGERIKFGALMLAARVFRRRNSPAGVAALGERGPVYVSRNDPELAMMLGIGNYRRPVVG